MICLLAFILLGLLVLFWITNKEIVRDVFESVIYNMSFRPHPPTHKIHPKKRKKAEKDKSLKSWFYRHIEVLSWLYVTILLITIFLVSQSIYNFTTYGTCTSPQQECVLDGIQKQCQEAKELMYPQSPDTLSIGKPTYNVELVEFGCYTCKQSKENYLELVDILQSKEGKIYYQFIDLPLENDSVSFRASEFAQCIRIVDEDNYWSIHSSLMYHQGDFSTQTLFSFSNKLNINQSKVQNCLESGTGAKMVQQSIVTARQSNVLGTPTYFLNNRAYQGEFPKNKMLRLAG